MAKIVSGTLPQPVRQHDAIRALLRAGKNDEAIVQLCAISITRPNDLEARELLFDAFYQKRDCAPALVCLSPLRCRTKLQRLRPARSSACDPFPSIRFGAETGSDIS
jgi:hypothetical protein